MEDDYILLDEQLNSVETSSFDKEEKGKDNQEVEATTRDSYCCRGVCCLGRLCFVWYRLGLTLQTLIMVVIGTCLGLLLNGVGSDSATTKLAAYPGKLFLNSLKLLVVPLIFTNMVLAVSMGNVGSVKFLGSRGLVYYLSTTVLAAMEGLLVVNLMQPGAHSRVGVRNATALESHGAAGDRDALDAVLGIGTQLLTDNIFKAFLETNILGVITFALLLVCESSLFLAC